MILSMKGVWVEGKSKTSLYGSDIILIFALLPWLLAR